MRRRSALALAALLAPPRLARADGLATAGWRHAEWPGIRPAARFTALPDGLSVAAEGGGSFVWRPAGGAAGCLAWRWRVEEGPPPMDLTRRGGDRALSVSVGFAGWPPQAGALARARHAAAQALAGGHPLPRSILVFIWGGTGQEPARFPSPYTGEISQKRILRTGTAPTHTWFMERIDLAAEWQAAFGGPAPPVQELAIGTDVDDSGARLRAQVEGIRLTSC